MESKHKIFIGINLIILISLAIIEFISFESHLNTETNNFYNKYGNFFYTIIENEKIKMNSIATSIANNNIVIDAYRLDNPNLIKEYYQEFMDTMKSKDFLTEVHFFTADLKSFANMSNLLASREDVSAIRVDVKHVLEQHKASNHFMVCRSFGGIRSVKPIIDNNGLLLGALSVGIKSNAIPQMFKNLTNLDSLFFNDINVTNSLSPTYFQDFISQATVFDNKIASSSTIKLTINQLQDISNIQEDQSWKIINLNSKKHVIYSYFLVDYNDQNIFRFIILEDISTKYQSFFYELFFKLVIVFFIILTVHFILFKKIIFSLSKLKTISKLAEDLKNKNFKTLKHFEIVNNNYLEKDEIDQLSYNILQMGLALKKFYENMQDLINQQTQEIKESIFIDNLTGLNNRRALERDIYDKDYGTLIFIDIDGFSTINDVYGADIGNYVLISTAEMLITIGEKNGLNLTVYRVGSDEYAIYSQRNKCNPILNVLTESLSNIKFEKNDDELQLFLDFTFGISCGQNISIENSDIALHQAKQQKIRFAIYDKSFVSQEQHKHNIALSKKIREGLKNGSFTLFYQPIFNTNREIIKYEGLIRLKDGDRFLPPYFFLQYAKKTKYYFDITKIVIDLSFKTFNNIDMSFSINLSADDILNTEIAKYIEDKLSKFTKPENVTFEILESEQIEQFEPVLEFIKKVKKYGSKIAIDDFGSGYSNFSYLLQIRPDYLKIDGSIIKKIAVDENSLLVAQTIVQFSKLSNFIVIAEFVDSEEVFKKCKDIGVDMFQGYYLGMPNHELVHDIKDSDKKAKV